MAIATLSTSEYSTPVDVPATPYDCLLDSDAYNLSCDCYQEKADKKLAHSDALVVTGYGVSLSVLRGSLVVKQGRTHMAKERTPITLHRNIHEIERIVIIGDGYFTSESLSWCKEQAISVILLERDGTLLQSLTPENESNAALRMKQYQALNTIKGLKIAIDLIRQKTEAQVSTLSKHLELEDVDAVSKYLYKSLRDIDRVKSVEKLRLIEASNAGKYFQCFIGIPLKWRPGDMKIIPEHWKTITNRTSPINSNGSGRWAINPFHCMLNYQYALLESACKQALTSQGFDTELGYLHSIKLHRSGLVFDILEIWRPLVEHTVLKLVSSMTFRKGDIIVGDHGEAKLSAQLARYVASCYSVPQSEIDATVLQLRRDLLSQQ
jgi:CRISP-associated protein Cas1